MSALVKSGILLLVTSTTKVDQTILPDHFPLCSPAREVGGMGYGTNGVADLLASHVDLLALFFETLAPHKRHNNSPCTTDKIHVLAPQSHHDQATYTTIHHHVSIT